MTASLEHLNITVQNPTETADRLSRLFGWHVRWAGPSLLGGSTIHVGTDGQYLAVYTAADETSPSHRADANGSERPKSSIGNLNHIGVQVDDLDAVEQLVIDEGLTPYNHGDYEPGRRFYFDDPDGIEFEVVSYS